MERFLYLCENSLEGIFSGIYKAYEDRHSHEENEIRIYTPSFNRELFCRYISVETDYDRACKVARFPAKDRFLLPAGKGGRHISFCDRGAARGETGS